MSASKQVATITPRKSVIADMADRYGMEPSTFEATVRKTCMPGNATVTPEQFAAFLVVAKEHRLNPMTREIYAFPAKGGGIQPIVGIDGWARIINEQPAMNGMEFVDVFGDDGKLAAVTCRIYRKDREHPTEVTEYMAECRRNTDVWKQWPSRMLRHKAMIQAARYAFGFSGIMEPDEYERQFDRPTIKAAPVTLHSHFSDATAAIEAETVDEVEVTVEPEPVEEQAPANDESGDVFPGDLPIKEAQRAVEEQAAEQLEKSRARTEAITAATQVADKIMAGLDRAASPEELDEVWKKSKDHRARIDEVLPERGKEIKAKFNARYEELSS